MVKCKWKYIENYESGEVELYNLEIDPVEQYNLAANHPEYTAKFKALLQQFREDTDAKMPTVNPDSQEDSST